MRELEQGTTGVGVARRIRWCEPLVGPDGERTTFEDLAAMLLADYHLNGRRSAKRRSRSRPSTRVLQELAALKAQAAADPTSVPRDRVPALEGYLLTQQGKPADALKTLMAADRTSVLVMNRIAEAHAALRHTAEAAAWNNRVTANYTLNLADFTNVNSRRRAKLETAGR